VIVLAMARRAGVWKTAAVLTFLVTLSLGMLSYEYFHVLLPMGPLANRFVVEDIERIS
jgi:hypothetical protein